MMNKFQGKTIPDLWRQYQMHISYSAIHFVFAAIQTLLYHHLQAAPLIIFVAMQNQRIKVVIFYLYISSINIMTFAHNTLDPLTCKVTHHFW